jgi:hypothetical protein
VRSIVPVKQRKNYIVFGSSEAMNRFFRRKISPTVNDSVEYFVMEKFRGNRILFTAEHAQTKRIGLEGAGKKAYIGIGDKNTEVLAKIGAYYLRSAYIVPRFIRTEADASRPPEDLGIGLRLFVKPSYAGQKTMYIPIHSNKSFLVRLNEYHRTIEQLDPRAIISVHGISMKREFDLLFGFGEDYETIGGKKEAFRFRHEFTEYLDSIFRETGIRANLKIAVSTWRFTGSQNHVLTKHIIEHNRTKSKGDPRKKRIGFQVEMNLRGRHTKGDDDLPTIPYQLTIQALGDFIYKWKNNNVNNNNAAEASSQ